MTHVDRRDERSLRACGNSRSSAGTKDAPGVVAVRAMVHQTRRRRGPANEELQRSYESLGDIIVEGMVAEPAFRVLDRLLM